jgi:hypothetical protein
MTRFLAPAAILLTTACGDQLFPASIDNVEEEVILGSLTSTPLSIPSGYSIPDARAVRTEISSAFDFAYVVNSEGQHFLVPLDALGLGSSGFNPGLIRSEVSFEAIEEAPVNGYTTSDSVTVAVGDVLVARSRIVCSLGVPQYVKLEVLEINVDLNTIRLRTMPNVNCGFRALLPGIPTS